MTYQFLLNIETNLNETLLRNEILFNDQKQEIKKSKATLYQLQKCLLLQNETLHEFLNEESTLSLEIARRIRNEKVEEKLKENVKDEVMKTSLLKRNMSEIIEDDCDIKKIEPTKKKSRLVNKKSKIQPKLIEIPQREHERITCLIFKYDCGDIFIGGSKGSLSRHSTTGVKAYDTDSQLDVRELALVSMNKTAYLLALTGERILIYDINSAGLHKKIELPDTRIVFNDENTTYIGLRGGYVRRLNRKDWFMKREIMADKADIKFFLLPSARRKFGLVVLQDSLLYKTADKNMLNLELVDGVSGVRMVMRYRKDSCLCYSEKQIWRIDSNGEVVDSVAFRQGIKLMSSYSEFVVVVDEKNRLHSYTIESIGFGKRIRLTRVSGNVSALGIHGSDVYAAVDNTIRVFSGMFSANDNKC